MRWRRILIGLAVCAALVAIVFALIPREPKYEGRTLSERIKESAPQRSPDPQTTKAIEAVRHIGTNGLPWLIKWISAKEPQDWQLKLTTARRLPRWVRLQLLPSLFGLNSYYAHRRTALDGFLILGPDAAPAVPELLRIVASTNASPAYGALESIGIAGIPAALTVLTNPAYSVRCRFLAFFWICRIDPKADRRYMLDRTVPLMARCLREKNPDFSPFAAEALAARHIEPGLVVPFYLNRLTNSDPDSRCGTARGLSHYGGNATSAVPALVIALKDTDPLVRYCAEDALFEIDQATLEKADPTLAGLKKHWRRTADSPPQRSEK
jgi:hypothetical protein